MDFFIKLFTDFHEIRYDKTFTESYRANSNSQQHKGTTKPLLSIPQNLHRLSLRSETEESLNYVSLFSFLSTLTITQAMVSFFKFSFNDAIRIETI